MNKIEEFYRLKQDFIRDTEKQLLFTRGLTISSFNTVSEIAKFEILRSEVSASYLLLVSFITAA